MLLIKNLLKLNKETTEIIDGWTAKYYEILRQDSYCNSDKDIFDCIKKVDIVLNTAEFDRLRDQVEQVFPREMDKKNEIVFIVGKNFLEEERKQKMKKKKGR